MEQSKKNSLIESFVNVALGLITGFLVNFIMLPLLGMHPSLGDNIIITAVFAVISIVRSYVIRRFFNWSHHAAH